MMALFCATIIAWSLLKGIPAARVGPVASLHINNADIAPDGFTRSAVLAEGAFPGPLITGKMGDTFRINVINQLTDVSMLKSTSIHWHGFFQKGSAWADGPSFVSQCPIAPGESFLYNFKTAGQAGTYWYHSHLSTQYCDGLRGPLVVYDPHDPHKNLYSVDNEQTIITLADWYHTVSPAAGAVPKPNATLINGLGRYTGGPPSPLAIINIVRGTRYRFRLISMACDPNYMFSIDEHTMTIIEADGVSTEPLTVDSIQIFAGQRYSFVLNAKQSVGNYWIRALPNVGTLGFRGGINKAILRYRGAPAIDPVTPSSMIPPSNPLLEKNLHALENPGAPGKPNINGADISLSLHLGFNRKTFHFTVNGATYESPTLPVLLQIQSGATPPTSLLPSGTIYSLPLNKVIQISIPALEIGGPHPLHLHGHNFAVVRSAGSSDYNFVNPVRRDVVSTGMDGDNVTIRFVTDNAGPWFLHCHIDWHLELGLAVVLAEDTPGVVASDSPPAAWKDLCPAYYTLSQADKGGMV